MVQSKSALSRGITRFELKRTEPYEAWLITQFDHTLVTSNLDRDTMISLLKSKSRQSDPPSQESGPGDGNQRRVSVLRNGVDLEYFQPGDADRRDPATVLVSGKMSYHANVTMVLRLIESIMPAVWARHPEVKVVIVGKDPPSRIQELNQDDRVTVTGTVRDIRPYLQMATVAVAPVEYGAGIQNKVLEAMACGTPVIATPQAVSAIDLIAGRDALIAESTQAFAEAAFTLLENREKQREIGANGRAFVERHYRWSDITDQLEAIYRQEIERKMKVANRDRMTTN
jgi:glycosyltransferase involved in cell wall biosynthesis